MPFPEFRGGCAGALLGAPVVLGAVVALVAAASAEKSDFWEKREAAYRESARGPFTAVAAHYLERGAGLRLFEADDALSALELGPAGELPDAPPAGAAAIDVGLGAMGFALVPVPGHAPATTAGEPVPEPVFFEQAGDDADVRLGRFLISLGMQGDDLGRVLVYDPDRLADFHGFPVFDDSDVFRVEARVVPGDGSTAELGTTRGLVKPFVRTAFLEFSLGGGACRLTGFRVAGDEAGPLFVPYRDATSGGDSYDVGRYLRVEPREDGTALVDFNRSTNPWCAYSPFYNCVLPPQENELAVEIRAGERAPAAH